MRLLFPQPLPVLNALVWKKQRVIWVSYRTERVASIKLMAKRPYTSQAEVTFVRVRISLGELLRWGPQGPS